MLKSFKTILMATLMGFALLASCGCAQSIRDGEVLSKRFVPAHDEDSMVLICADPPMYSNQTDHIPDCWYVTIGKKCEDGKFRTRTLSVSQSTYKRVQKGEWFNME